MTSFHLNYAQVKSLNKALGTYSDAFHNRDALETFVKDICAPLVAEPSSINPSVFLTDKQLHKLLEGFSGKAPSEFRSTERIEILAEAFGWRGDAFMHKLKTEFQMQEAEAWKRVAHIYDRFGYGDVKEWMQALRAEKGLLLVSSPTSGGKTSFAGLTTALVNNRFKSRKISVCANSLISAARGEDIIQSKFHELAKLTFRLGLDQRSFPAWPAKTEDKLLIVYDVSKASDVEMIFEAAKSHLVIATAHGANVQHTLKRFGYALEDKDALRAFRCGIALKMSKTKHSEGLPNNVSLDAELVAPKGKAQVSALLERGVESGFYSRAFCEAHLQTSPN